MRASVTLPEGVRMDETITDRMGDEHREKSKDEQLKDEEFLRMVRRITFHGMTHEQMAKDMGIPYVEFKHRYYRAIEKERYTKFIEDNQGDLYKPELFAVDRYKPLEFETDNFVAVCDIHVPCTDYDYAMLPAAIARKHLPEGERNLFVHGDVFNQDVFSRWPKVVKSPTWEDERLAAANLFAIWAKTFDRIIITPGNHDYRILMKLEGQSSFAGVMWDMIVDQDKDLQQMFGAMFSTGRLTTSPVDHVTVKTPKGVYTIAHGSSYSINAMTVASEMAQKYQSHMITGHEHHIGQTMDRFGRYFIINNGGLFDESKFAYIALQASKRPIMKKGFTMVRNGYPTVFGPWIDWSIWL